MVKDFVFCALALPAMPSSAAAPSTFINDRRSVMQAPLATPLSLTAGPTNDNRFHRLEGEWTRGCSIELEKSEKTGKNVDIKSVFEFVAPRLIEQSNHYSKAAPGRLFVGRPARR